MLLATLLVTAPFATPLRTASADAAVQSVVWPASPEISRARNDPLPFIAMLARRIVHGDRDDRIPPETLRSLIQRGDVILTCGPAVDFVRAELERVGVQSHNVALMRPGPPNGFDDGHILLEVRTAQGNVLVDVDQKWLFLIDGRPASLAQIQARGFDHVELFPLAAPARVDPAFALAKYERAIIANPRPWYARMFAGSPTSSHSGLSFVRTWWALRVLA